MSGVGHGEALPTWDQLITGWAAAPVGGWGTGPRHARLCADDLFGGAEAMPWHEAASWSALAVGCALAVAQLVR